MSLIPVVFFEWLLWCETQYEWFIFYFEIPHVYVIYLPSNCAIHSVMTHTPGFLLNMMTSSNENIFPRDWPFVRGIHRSPVNSPHKGQWRGALMFSLICAWIFDWATNREAGDLRRHRVHYDVIVMKVHLWLALDILPVIIDAPNNIQCYACCCSMTATYTLKSISNERLYQHMLCTWYLFINSLRTADVYRYMRR